MRRVDAMARAQRLQNPDAYEDDEAWEAAAYGETPTPPPIPEAAQQSAFDPADPNRPIGGLKPTFVPKDLGTMESHPDMATTRRTGTSRSGESGARPGDRDSMALSRSARP